MPVIESYSECRIDFEATESFLVHETDFCEIVDKLEETFGVEISWFSGNPAYGPFMKIKGEGYLQVQRAAQFAVYMIHQSDRLTTDEPMEEMVSAYA